MADRCPPPEPAKGSPSSSLMSLKRLLFLGTLYFVQGLPFGFQAKALPVYLRGEGVSLRDISFLGLLSLPWSLKVLWAPLVDHVYSRRIGRRKSWIIPCQLVVAVAAMIPALRSGPQGLPLVLACILVMNLAASTQDIAVDGLAMALLEDREMGLGNTAQVVGFKVGMLTGGGLLSYICEAAGWGWRGVFVGISLLVLSSVAQVALFQEPAPVATEGRRGSLPAGAPGTSKGGRLHVGAGAPLLRRLRDSSWDQWEWLRQPAPRRMALLAVTYKMGEAAGDVMFKPFLVDAGVSSAAIGLWTGVYGMLFSIAGSTLGGLAISRLGGNAVVALPAAGVARLVPQIARWLLACWGPQFVAASSGTVVTTVCAEALAGGFLTTCMFAAMMVASGRDRASHFTLLATLEVIGKSLATLPAGFFAERYGYQVLFAGAAALSAAWVPLLAV